MFFKKCLLAAAAAAAAGTLLIFPAQAAAGAAKGMGYCLEVLVPSLYPFMVLSVFVVRSGLAQSMGKLLEKPTRVLFRLPGCAAAAVMMSAIGGYPAGARAVASLYEQGAITQKQAERMLFFCVNAGPSFLIAAVGVGFLNSARSGLILFLAQMASFLVSGVVFGLGSGKEKTAVRTKPERVDGVSGALISSAADAAHSTMLMCCFVILFAAFLNLLRIAVTAPIPAAVLSLVLEVTGGCSDLAALHAPLWAIAFAVGWGGVCVHFQVYALASSIRPRRALFVVSRLLQGVLCVIFCLAFSSVFPGSVEAAVIFRPAAPAALSSTVPASAALLLLCAGFLFSLPDGSLEIVRKRCYNKH